MTRFFWMNRHLWSFPIGLLLLVGSGCTFFASPPPFPGLGWRITSIAMLSKDEGWAVGDSTGPISYLLLHYQHRQWHREYPFREGSHILPETHVQLTSISLSHNEGWAVGQGFFATTRPTMTTHGIAQSGTIGKVFFHYQDRKWSVAAEGPTDPEFGSVVALPNRHGWMLGSTGAGYTILHNNGSTWLPIIVPNAIDIVGFTTLAALSDTDIWLAGAKLAHFDGRTWTIDQIPARPGTSLLLQSLVMLSHSEMWAVGDAGNQGIIVHIFSGHLQTVSVPHGLMSIAMLSSTAGWAVGTGVMYAYHGTAWTAVPCPTNQPLSQVIGVPGSTEAWAVSTNGTIIHEQQGVWSVAAV